MDSATPYTGPRGRHDSPGPVVGPRRGQILPGRRGAEPPGVRLWLGYRLEREPWPIGRAVAVRPRVRQVREASSDQDVLTNAPGWK